MNRLLIAVPIGAPGGDQLLVGAEPVGPNYPRPYREADFQGWAADVNQLHLAMARDPSGRLLEVMTSHDPALQQTHKRFFGDPRDGINGDLVQDDDRLRVELNNGRHRAHYQTESGSACAPVWVRSHDVKALAAFDDTCASYLRQREPRLAEAYNQLRSSRPAERLDARPSRDRDIRRGRKFDRAEHER